MKVNEKPIQLEGWKVLKFLDKVSGPLAQTLHWALEAHVPLETAVGIAEAAASAIYDTVIAEELPHGLLPKAMFDDISSVEDEGKRQSTVIMKSRSGRSTATITEEITDGKWFLSVSVSGEGNYLAIAKELEAL